MKNPYVYGFLPFITILLFSASFGLFAVNYAVELFQEIGLYDGMLEIFTDMQIRLLMLVVCSLLFFALFAALKVIAEAIHELAMLLFAKEVDPNDYRKVRSGNLIYVFGALFSFAGMQSLIILLSVFAITTVSYFIFNVYRMSKYMKAWHAIAFTLFQIVAWFILLFGIAFTVLKLYNGLMDSLPLVDSPEPIAS